MGVLVGHLGKLGPGDKVIIFLHSDEGHVGVALCVWQERVFTRVLAVVQNLSFAAAEGRGERPRHSLLRGCVIQGLELSLKLCYFCLEILNSATRCPAFHFAVGSKSNGAQTPRVCLLTPCHIAPLPYVIPEQPVNFCFISFLLQTEGEGEMGQGEG